MIVAAKQAIPVYKKGKFRKSLPKILLSLVKNRIKIKKQNKQS